MSHSNLYAGLEPKRQAIYRCAHLDLSSDVDSATIYKSQFGDAPHFYEIRVHYFERGLETSYIKKVNYRPRYNGMLEHFTTGNFRIKVDRVRSASDGNYWAFARIPSHNIHSMNWSCKDVK